MAKTKSGKRRNNEGSIIGKENGTFRVFLSLGRNDDGTLIRLSRTFSTYQEANAFRIQKLAEHQQFGAESAKEATGKFADNYFEWLLYEKRPTVQSRHFNIMIGIYERFVKTHLSKYNDKDITTKVLKDLFAKLEKQGVGIETLRKFKVQLHQYFEYSLQNSPMRNPADYVKVAKKKDNAIITPEDMRSGYKAIKKDVREKFLLALDNERSSPFLKPLCYLMFFIGIRIGECLALQWKDFDFENRYFFVYKAITRQYDFDDNGVKLGNSRVALGPPKSKDGVRPLPLIDILYEAMLEWKEYRKAQEIPRFGAFFTRPDDFVFCNDMGQLRSEDGTDTIFRRFLKRNGLENEGIHFHALRQTFSNAMFASDFDEQIIKDTIGHASISTTKLHYKSIEKFDSVKKAAQHLNAIYPPKNPQNRASEAVKFTPEGYISETDAISKVAQMHQPKPTEGENLSELLTKLSILPEFQQLLQKLQQK